jgi:hypothetical protein
LIDSVSGKVNLHFPQGGALKPDHDEAIKAKGNPSAGGHFATGLNKSWI